MKTFPAHLGNNEPEFHFTFLRDAPPEIAFDLGGRPAGAWTNESTRSIELGRAMAGIYSRRVIGNQIEWEPRVSGERRVEDCRCV